MHYLIPSVAGFISFVLLDYIWLAKIAKSFYLEKLREHVNISSGALVPYFPAIPLVYIVAVLAIQIFAISKATSIQSAFVYGGMLGFCMYAFYDFTNLATLKNYPWSLAIVDILWGTLLVAIVTAIMWYTKTFF